MKEPTRKEVIAKILLEIENEESSEEVVLQGLRVLKKHDEKLFEAKLYEMYHDNIKIIPICDLVLTHQPKEVVKGVGAFDDDSFKITGGGPIATKGDIK